MIVKMKKIHLIVQKKDVKTALRGLRNNGTVHIEHLNKTQEQKLDELQVEIEDLKRVINVLEGYRELTTDIEQQSITDYNKVMSDIFGFLAGIEETKGKIEKHHKLINYWQPWGDFNIEDIKELSDRGLYIRLYELSKNDIKNVPDDKVFETISSTQGIYRCIALSDRDEDLPFKEVPLPEYNLNEMKVQLEKNKSIVSENESNIRKYVKYFDGLSLVLHEKQEALKFEQVASGMKEEGKLSLLKGYCPIDKIEDLQALAKTQNWGLLIEDPSDKEAVPTLLRNPKWVEVIKPVFTLINILPSYKELDISFFFLLFFSIFFSMIIGDAAYGIILFLITAFIHIKLKDRIVDKNPFILFYILSLCTVIWGFLTGTFFGQQWLPQSIDALLPWLKSNKNIQMLCFFLGAVHLSIAHTWRAIIRFPHLTALGESGWILIVWGMFFTAKMFVLGIDFPKFAVPLFIFGSALIILFTDPKKNIFKTLGAGLGAFLQNVINTFTDIVSYIRLFAVGIATVALADAANELAMGIGFSNFFMGFITTLILVIGHVFNIVLGAMSVLVHDLRLNLLEFSGHLDMEWSGFNYNPFRKEESSLKT